MDNENLKPDLPETDKTDTPDPAAETEKDSAVSKTKDAPPKKKKKLWLTLVIAAVLLAAAAVVVFAVLPALGGQSIGNPMPLLYQQNGEVYVGSGENTASLGNAQFVMGTSGDVMLNAMYSWDNSRMIYLADVDAKTGMGSLMQAQTDGRSQPVKIADNVAAARLSLDGTKVLYVTVTPDQSGSLSITGDLYLCKIGESPVKIGEKVRAENFEFSPSGNSFYYVTMEKVDQQSKNFALYTHTDSEDSVKVHEVAGRGSLPYDEILLGDNGAVSFIFWNNDTQQGELYRAKGAAAELVANNAYVVQTFGDVDDKLYMESGKLYYKAPGKDAELISESYSDIAFPDYQGPEPHHVPDKHFVYAEKSSDGNSVTLYEQTIGKDRIKIAEADSATFAVQASFQWLSCFQGGELCLYHKTGNGWEKGATLGENFISYGFDYSKPDSYYYVKTDSKNAESGDAYICSLKTGESTLIQEDVTGLFMSGWHVFVVGSDNTLREFDGGGTFEVAKGVSSTQRTYGGFYVISGTDGSLNIDLYADNSTKLAEVVHGAQSFVLPAMKVGFALPLLDEQKSLLNDFHHDATILLDIVQGGQSSADDTVRTVKDNSLYSMAALMYDMSEETYRMFYYYYMGFSTLSSVDMDSADHEDSYYTGVGYILYAEQLYTSYMTLQ